jgi:SAM-dependent methyltransferase
LGYCARVPVLFDAILACPRCHGELGREPDRLVCAACDVSFAVVDGVPHLADGAVDKDPRMAAEWQAQHNARGLYLDTRSIANHWEERVLPRLVDWLGDQEGPILDVGCGVGHLGRALAREGKSAELVGLDFQAELLAEVREGYVARIEGDIHRLPLRDGAFSAVVTANALHHVADPERAAGELARILSPGGLLVAYDPRHLVPLELVKKMIRRNDEAFTDDHRAFRPGDYRSLLAGAGLEVQRLEAVDPVGPLLAAGLDLLRVGRLGFAEPLAHVLTAIDRAVGRVDVSRSLGLMVLALARKP